MALKITDLLLGSAITNTDLLEMSQNVSTTPISRKISALMLATYTATQFFPILSTVNAIPRFSNSTGYPLVNSGVLIDVSNNVTGILNLTITGTLSAVKGNFLTSTGSDGAIAIGKSTFAVNSILFTGDGTSYYSDSNNPADVTFFRSGVGRLRVADANLTGSAIFETNTITSFGANVLTIPVTINLSTSTSVIQSGGIPFIWRNSSAFTTSVGINALANNTGDYNTAVGYNALHANVGPNESTAFGHAALEASNAPGNTAVGVNALASITGGSNTAMGRQAMWVNITGVNNTVMGWEVLHGATSGDNNTAYGCSALSSATSPASCIAIGYQAGINVTGSPSNNIHIGNTGSSGDTNVIIIGNGQTSATINATTTNVSTLAATQVNVTRPDGTSLAYTGKFVTDTTNRWQMTADGVTEWGPGGTSTFDTVLKRSGVATLRLTDSSGSGNGIFNVASLQANSYYTASGAFVYSTTSTSINIGGGIKVSLFSGNSNGNSTSLSPNNNITSSYNLIYPPAQGSANQFMTNDGSGNLSWSSVAAGTGISVSGTTVNVATGGLTWSTIVAASQNISVGNAYITNRASLITFTLPIAANVGDTFRIVGAAPGGWKIAQNANQFIQVGNSVTTTGTGGSVASTGSHDLVEIVCTFANLNFIVTSSFGTLTVV